jgi:hypothetical protein
MEPSAFEAAFEQLPTEPDPLEPADPFSPAEPAGLSVDTPMPWDAGPDDSSEPEQFVQSGRGLEFLDEVPASPAPAAELMAQDVTAPRPSFFPEEEFGRAVPEVEEVEFIDMDSAMADTAVIETSTGKKIRLDVPDDLESAYLETPGVTPVAGPSVFRAIGAGFVAAVAGGLLWALLAIPAGQGASALALAVGLMVGFSVRLKGNGHSMIYRIIGVFYALLGSVIGGILASATLTVMNSPDRDLGFVIGILSDSNAAMAAFMATYVNVDKWYAHLLSLALGLYIAFRISASKAE